MRALDQGQSSLFSPTQVYTESPALCWARYGKTEGGETKPSKLGTGTEESEKALPRLPTPRALCPSTAGQS